MCGFPCTISSLILQILLCNTGAIHMHTKTLLIGRECEWWNANKHTCSWVVKYNWRWPLCWKTSCSPYMNSSTAPCSSFRHSTVLQYSGDAVQYCVPYKLEYHIIHWLMSVESTCKIEHSWGDVLVSHRLKASGCTINAFLKVYPT